MTRAWTCAGCGATNEQRWTVCEGCGAERRRHSSAAGGHGPAQAIRTVCDCGAVLLGSGICSVTGGYPATSACPFACPICRGGLGWDGGCERCRGCTTGRREDWTFPGDCYELDKG